MGNPFSVEGSAKEVFCPFLSAEERRKEWFRSIESDIFLGSQREDFVVGTYNTLSDLVAGRMKGSTRHNRVLLGSKAVGKSSLLGALCSASRKVFADKGLLVVQISYPSPSDASEDPVETIMKQLNAYQLLEGKVGPRVRLQTLTAHLEVTNCFVFATIDAFPNCYRKGCTLGKEIVDAVANIADDRSGRIFCILSGRSTHLRPLATANLPEGLKSTYPNYDGVDLNMTKLLPWTLFPIVEEHELQGLVNFFITRRGDFRFQGGLGELLLRTGGLPGLVCEQLFSVKPIPVMCSQSARRSVSGPQHCIVEAIVELVISTYTMHLTDAESPLLPIAAGGKTTDERALWDRHVLWYLQQCVKLVDYRAVESAVRRKLSDSDFDVLGAVIDMADRGILRFVDEHPARVGLLTDICMLQMVERDYDFDVTSDEIVALWTGNQGCGRPTMDLAGDVTLRLIANSAFRASERSVEWFGFEIHQRSTRILASLTLRPNVEAAFELNVMYRERVSGTAEDALGADGCVLVPSSTTPGTFDVFRIRVEIIGKTLSEESAQELAEQVSTLASKTRDAYLSSGIVLDKHVFILTTTADITPASREMLMTAGIVIWDHRFLATRVWPSAVKLIGKRFCC